VFRTNDGGAHWQRVLFINDSTGVIDMAMDPANPRVILAWAWHVESGTDGGMYRTTDGGDHWEHVTRGLPSGPLGRAGLNFAPSDPRIVYVFLDNRARSSRANRPFVGGQVYRSDDTGVTWHSVTDADLYSVFGEDGWKFTDIRVSPRDANDLFILGNRGFHSHDGGRTWKRIGDRILRVHDTPGLAMHLDQHEIWIDPLNPDRILLGNDGGLFESYDEGESWLHLNSIPVAQMYFVATDDQFPYNIYAGTQDDAAIYGPSNASVDDAVPDTWQNVYLDPWTGGDSFVTLPDPTNSRYVYYEHQYGAMRRMDLHGVSVNSFGPSSTDINPRASGDTTLRFSWYTPFLISRYDPRTLYAAGSKVLKTTDRGATWRVISPEIADPAGERRATVPTGAATMLVESPIARGTLIAGTEGGSLWRTTDDGANWSRIGTSLPRKWISRVVISAYRRGTIYVSMTGFREDDARPYIFVSDDAGRTWRSISANLPLEAVNVIKEDPYDPDILYVGTDLGVYVSLDRGNTWQSLGATLPSTPVQDLTVQARDRELVVGSYGRGAWILDVAPIEWYARESRAGSGGGNALHVFTPRAARLTYFPWETVPAEPPRGRASALIQFVAPDSGQATMIVRDSAGRTIRQLVATVYPGINGIRWDLQSAAVAGRDPRDVRPATYTVELNVNGAHATTRLSVLAPILDPRK
jgi:photosystem II stability/assembly factor-like uncharacterized protein